MSIYWITSLGIVSIIVYHYEIVPWIRKTYQKLQILQKLTNLDIEQPKENIPSFVINDTDLSAQISYQRVNSKYPISVPYNRKYVIAMSQFKAELLRKDKPTLDITQQPGLPYLVSPSDLGGYMIKITNEETGSVASYIDKSPMYAEEIMFSE